MHCIQVVINFQGADAFNITIFSSLFNLDMGYVLDIINVFHLGYQNLAHIITFHMFSISRFNMLYASL